MRYNFVVLDSANHASDSSVTSSNARVQEYLASFFDTSKGYCLELRTELTLYSVKKCFKKFKIDFDSDYCITAIAYGLLSEKETEQLKDGSCVAGSKLEKLIQTAFCSPLFQSHLSIQRKKVLDVLIRRCL
jgi:hypothetical protein